MEIFLVMLWKIFAFQKSYYRTVLSNANFGHDPFNPLKPEFTFVIFIHYKPRIAVAILDF